METALNRILSETQELHRLVTTLPAVSESLYSLADSVTAANARCHAVSQCFAPNAELLFVEEPAFAAGMFIGRNDI